MMMTSDLNFRHSLQHTKRRLTRRDPDDSDSIDSSKIIVLPSALICVFLKICMFSIEMMNHTYTHHPKIHLCLGFKINGNGCYLIEVWIMSNSYLIHLIGL